MMLESLRTFLASPSPIFTYSFIAALFLLMASLISGWWRRDGLVLLRPSALFHVVLAVLMAALLIVLEGQITHYGQRFLPNTFWGEQVNTHVMMGWPLGGGAHLPLYIVALAYGPSVGLVTGALFAGFHARGAAPGADELSLLLHLTVLGWLAIAPSPFKTRWAGPINVIGAYVLATITSQLAFLSWHSATFAPTQLLQGRSSELGGVLLSAVLLLALGPRFYTWVFGFSRISPYRDLTLRKHSTLNMEEAAEALEELFDPNNNMLKTHVLLGVPDKAFQELPINIHPEMRWLWDYLLHAPEQASSVADAYRAFVRVYPLTHQQFKARLMNAQKQGWLRLVRDKENKRIYITLQPQPEHVDSL